MAVPIAAIAGIAMKILPMLMEEGSIGRSNLGGKNAYFQQLMGMLQPNYNSNKKQNGQTVQGEGGLGGIEGLMGLLKGGGQTSPQQEYNPFNDIKNNDWNMEGYGG
jgi:hypothetical protein